MTLDKFLGLSYNVDMRRIILISIVLILGVIMPSYGTTHFKSLTLQEKVKSPYPTPTYKNIVEKPQPKYISINDFLRDAQGNWDELYIQNEVVMYKGKIVLSDSSNKPLTKGSAYNTLEIKIAMYASGQRPRKNCVDGTLKNGSMGCWMK